MGRMILSGMGRMGRMTWMELLLVQERSRQ